MTIHHLLTHSILTCTLLPTRGVNKTYLHELQTTITAATIALSNKQRSEETNEGDVTRPLESMRPMLTRQPRQWELPPFIDETMDPPGGVIQTFQSNKGVQSNPQSNPQSNQASASAGALFFVSFIVIPVLIGVVVLLFT